MADVDISTAPRGSRRNGAFMPLVRSSHVVEFRRRGVRVPGDPPDTCPANTLFIIQLRTDDSVDSVYSSPAVSPYLCGRQPDRDLRPRSSWVSVDALNVDSLLARPLAGATMHAFSLSWMFDGWPMFDVRCRGVPLPCFGLRFAFCKGGWFMAALSGRLTCGIMPEIPSPD